MGGKIRLGKDNFGTPKVKQLSGKTEAIVRRKLKDFKKSTDYTEKHNKQYTTK